MRPEDGFDLGAFARRIQEALPGQSITIRWSAAETLRTIRFRDKDASAGDLQSLFAAFSEVIKLRLQISRRSSIQDESPDCPRVSSTPAPDVSVLASWFALWCEAFGIKVAEAPVDRMIALSPVLHLAVSQVGRDAVATMCETVWEEQKLKRLKATALEVAAMAQDCLSEAA
jgi:hypothetical protein